VKLHGVLPYPTSTHKLVASFHLSVWFRCSNEELCPRVKTKFPSACLAQPGKPNHRSVQHRSDSPHNGLERFKSSENLCTPSIVSYGMSPLKDAPSRHLGYWNC
jgi:hypothetical protein